MFYHGWNAYIQYAFPDDELRPLTCDGLSKNDSDPTNTVINDVLGGYSVTLIDSLDMFAILNDQEGFEKNVERVRRYVSFNISSTVQVFETTIRAIGGLLSAHLYASVPRLGHQIEGYDGHLLAQAHDLGERLLPSFDTISGIPRPRINLMHGVAGAKVTPEDNPEDITETCTSGAGSLVLEFGLLSRLTGDYRFEQAAKRAFFAIWARRSDLDLVAMAIDSTTGNWLSPMTGNGASIDSYYEYALKYSVLFGSKDFLNVYNKLHRGLMANSFDGWMFHNINFLRGNQVAYWIDSLAAFYPSIMALAGDISNAVRAHLMYFKIWNTFAALPERWNAIPFSYRSKFRAEEAVNLEWYPLRPEFVESNYYIYRATKDVMFLQMGKCAMKDLKARNKVTCGYAGTQDIRTGKLSNRMESFFLSETTKYLYLLFDEDNVLNTEYSNFVFSTEAHPFWYDQDVINHATAQQFSNLEHIWGPHHPNDSVIISEKEDGDRSQSREFIQFNENISQEHAKYIRDILEEEYKPWYQKLKISVLWGDLRSGHHKSNGKGFMRRALRKSLYYLRKINSSVDRFLFSKLHGYMDKYTHTRKERIHPETTSNVEEYTKPTNDIELQSEEVTNIKSKTEHSRSQGGDQTRTMLDYNTTTKMYNPENIRFFFSSQCEVWQPETNLYTQSLDGYSHMMMKSGLYSYVSTWPEFYELDRLYMFKRPRYLRDYVTWEDRDGFGARYTIPEGVCQAPIIPTKNKSKEYGETLDMFFLVPEGGKRGEVVSRYKNGNVEATSLNGLRIKIRLAADGGTKKLDTSVGNEDYVVCEDPEVKCEFVDSEICQNSETDCESHEGFEDIFEDGEEKEVEDIGETVPEYNLERVNGIEVRQQLVLQEVWISGDGAGLVKMMPDGKLKVDKYILRNVRLMERDE